MSDTDKLISDLAKSIEECARLRAALAEKDAALAAAASELNMETLKATTLPEAIREVLVQRDAVQRQVAALREALDSMRRFHSGRPDSPAAKVLADAEAAARTHDDAVRAQAFEEACEAICARCQCGGPVVREDGGAWYHGGPANVATSRPCGASALREKARKP